MSQSSSRPLVQNTIRRTRRISERRRLHRVRPGPINNVPARNADKLGMTKSELRKAFLVKRQSMTRPEHDIASARIAANFFDNIDLAKINVLHCFISIERSGEIDTVPIFKRIWSDLPFIVTAVPRINLESNELESIRYAGDTELSYNHWQIGEPIHNDRIDPFEIDIVLVPLLCFDRRGHRVGYGKGYYDRFLARCRPDCQRVGLSIFPPIDEIEDAHAGDFKLDLCVTPDKIFTF